MENLVTCTLELTVDGRERKCPVYVPAALNAAHPAPLLLVFHGAEGTGASMIKKFRALADRNGFLLAAPDGLGGRWNARQPDEIEATGNADEPAFIDSILNTLNKEYSIDPDRIYAAGFSNGGALCQRLAVLPDSPLAAIACVGATLPAVLKNQIASAPPVSVLLLAGSNDEFFSSGGSKIGPFLSVDETARLWAKHDGCSQVTPSRWINEKTGVEVQSRWIEGGRHSWRLSADLDTSLTVWEFLSAHFLYARNS